ncbi:rRNA 2'-O-methyltransferase fibrillarin [Histomonas meleagridis]|uniref:rRNA 2'-O-methyltransferase fibrillarin n=1 Tax=Histomonas meleagridis TaxID=135588 RepID=UPI003559CF93|nr:rRNA 2'-O-methyltransferase fibrillarin [Histomonas meleagridis]KAH0799474.1 rRNA 2'-O-methyltransferase fibrillarin [Histomonas meleagridis]
MDRGRGRGGNRDNGSRGGRGGGGRGGFKDKKFNGDRKGGNGGKFDKGRGGRNDRGGNNRGNRGSRGGNNDNNNRLTIEPSPFEGVFKCHSKADYLVTKNLTPGKSVYGEKLMSVDGPEGPVEYREWNPYRSKIGACILSGLENMGIKPGSKVLYLGASTGTTISHVSDIVGLNGRVYGVEFSHIVAREFVNLAKMRPNIVPIIEDARHPEKYRMCVPMVDCLFADVAQPDQARIFIINAKHFLKNGGFFMFCIKASCVDSTLEPKEVFQTQTEELKKEGFVPEEEIDLETYHRGHAMVIGTYRPN